MVGSYNPAESVLDEVISPNPSEETSEASTTLGWFSRSDSGKQTAASSFPGGGFDMTSLKSENPAGTECKKKAGVPSNG